MYVLVGLKLRIFNVIDLAGKKSHWQYSIFNENPYISDRLSAPFAYLFRKCKAVGGEYNWSIVLSVKRRQLKLHGRLLFVRYSCFEQIQYMLLYFF